MASKIFLTCLHFQLDIPITASTKNAVYDVVHVDDDVTAAAWAVNVDTWDSPAGAQRIIKNTTIVGTYSIHAQLCVPNITPDNGLNVLQIATHGVFYDSRYWHSALDPENHSYVEASLKAGYSILTWDRLGVGQSDHPDAYTVVQMPLELEILKQITLMARNGTILGSTKHLPGYRAPDKVVHVSHSFGSILTSGFISKYPSLSDGAIITGYVLTNYLGARGYTSWSVVYAATADPPYDRTSGYVVPYKSGIQTVFFGGEPGVAFTKEQLDYGNAIKQPVPVGELASAYQVLGLPESGFEGPIQYMLPENDFFICEGDCRNIFTIEQLYQNYPNASTIEAYFQPNTGHALPLHNNATAGFQVSFDFLQRNGLGPNTAMAN